VVAIGPKEMGHMIRAGNKWIACASLLLALGLSLPAGAYAGSKSFAFVNQRYAITAEVAGEHKFVLNFINLSDFVIVVQPSEFIYKGASGRYYIGQVFDLESKNGRGEMQKYSASYLLKGHSFAGFSLIGAFHEQDQIEELSVRIGARRYYLQPVESSQFEQLAVKISNLDLENASTAAALEEANIPEMGTVKSTDGTAEWDRDWQGLLAADGTNPPKIIERPEIPLTNEARKSRTYGKVRLSGFINKNGGIQDLKVLKGLERSLDKRAMEGVANSWVFLPATKNGEVLETSFSIEVEFPPPAKKAAE
jgi:TonB family protein